MSQTDDRDADRTDDERRDRTDASDLSDEGLGATASDEPNTMEPEEALPEDDPEDD